MVWARFQLLTVSLLSDPNFQNKSLQGAIIVVSCEQKPDPFKFAVHMLTILSSAQLLKYIYIFWELCLHLTVRRISMPCGRSELICSSCFHAGPHNQTWFICCCYILDNISAVCLCFCQAPRYFFGLDNLFFFFWKRNLLLKYSRAETFLNKFIIVRMMDGVELLFPNVRCQLSR